MLASSRERRVGLCLLLAGLAALWSAPAAEAQQTLTETLVHDGLERTYIVYIPSGYDGSSAVPLLFNFHGYGGSAANHVAYGDMRAEAEANTFLLVYPQGSLLNGVPHWNVGSWTAASTADDIGFTSAMIDALSAAYTLDLDRVYGAGYSNGGYFSFELACRLSDRIAAVGSVAGAMSTETYEACSPSHPMPVVQIHGTSDGAVSYEGGVPVGSRSIDEVLDYWSVHNDTAPDPVVTVLPDLDESDGSTVEYHAYEGGEAGVAVGHYKVIGGGHDWPDVDGDPAQVNVDISASRVVWDFVSRYDINGLIESPTGLSGQVSAPDRVEVFPNPTSGSLTVEAELRVASRFRVSSVLGEVVLDGRIAPEGGTIDVSHLPAGLYILQVGSHATKVVKL